MDLFKDPNVPDWMKVIHIEDDNFEHSRWAGDGDRSAFRIKDLNILRKVLPNVYESAAREVKEENDYFFEHARRFQKLRLGRKIGSIPLWDAGLHPELTHDKKAQEKYWSEHPEFKSQRPK